MKKNYALKPYNRCLYCPRRLSDPPECDGPRTSAMKTDRWREYMRDIKEVSGMTYEEIAAKSDGMLSEGTIQNVLAPGAKGDITRETARLIENALFGSSNKHPCPIDLLEAIPAEQKKVMEVESEMAELRKNIEFMHSSYKVEMDAIRAEAQKKIDYLRDENARLHRIIDKLTDK